MKRRSMLETARHAPTVDPLAILDRLPARHEAAEERLPMYEVELQPPVGMQVSRVTVAGSYRMPVPILFDHGTRTAYPIRNDA